MSVDIEPLKSCRVTRREVEGVGLNKQLKRVGIMSLMPANRWLIFNKLKYNERLNCRIVCKVWKSEIEESLQFNITINDEFQDASIFKFFYSIHIGIIFVSHFMNPLAFSNILQFPADLNEVFVQGQIALHNFIQFLQLPQLLKLRINVNDIMVPDEDKTESSSLISPSEILGMNFPKVQKTLKILSLVGPIGQLNAGYDSTYPKMIFERFLESRFFSLQSFEIPDVHTVRKSESEFEYSALLINFVIEHHNTLRSIRVNVTSIPMVETSYWKCVAMPIPYPYSTALKDEHLGKIKLSQYSLIPPNSGVGTYEWARMLYFQDKLEIFSGNFHKCSLRLYVPVLQKNFSTLQSVKLTSIIVWESDTNSSTAFKNARFEPFDLRHFKSCSRLKNLIMSRSASDQSPMIQVAEMEHLEDLPRSLTSLAIKGFKINSSELAFLYTESPKLKLLSLTLNGVGSKGPFGVNPSTLKDLVDNLTEMKSFIVDPINVRTTKERNELKDIFNQLDQVWEDNLKNFAVFWEFIE